MIKVFKLKSVSSMLKLKINNDNRNRNSIETLIRDALSLIEVINHG
jgi:hypothetical protein